MSRGELLREVRSTGIFAEVSAWRSELRDWRCLDGEAVAKQWKEIHEVARAPKTPRLYSTHLRLEESDLLRRQLRREGLINAVLVGNLQACEAGSYQSSRGLQSLRQPLSRVLGPRTRARGSARLEVVDDQDALELCRAAAMRGQRCALVQVAPEGRDLRESPLYLRTSYAHAVQAMPRQLQRELGEVLKEGVIHTAHVSIMRGQLAEGAEWLEPVEIEVLTVPLQRTPRCDRHEQYVRIREKAQVVKTIDDIFACAADLGIEVLVFPPMGLTGGCYHPAADMGQILRDSADSGGDLQVFVAKEQQGPLIGWSSLSEAVTEGRGLVKREPPIPLHVSPYFNCYLGKRADFSGFTLPPLSARR